VDGYLPNNCSSIGEITTNLNLKTFDIDVQVIEKTGSECGIQNVPFQELISLDVSGLPAGDFSVDINGRQESFILHEQDLLDTNDGLISGKVWQDICDVSTLAQGTNPEPGKGCSIKESVSYSANGMHDGGEPGLEGLLVDLGQGACPSSGLGATITDGDGFFLFTGLREGTYCVSVDAKYDQNARILSLGEWAFPDAVLSGRHKLTLADGEIRTGVNFGWEFLTDPLPERADPLCRDRAKFAQDPLIPVEVKVEPGEVFIQTWRLVNSGSCTWTTDYDFVFDGGDEMNSPETVALPVSVSPGEAIDLSITLTAPGKPGLYRGEWKLRNDIGKVFGIGSDSNKSLWVQIVVHD
jgi:hypothetical protein